MSEIQVLVDALAASLRRPVDLDDRRFRVIAYSSHAEEIDAVRRASLLQREAPREVVEWLESLGIGAAEGMVRVPPNPDFGMAARVCVPIRFDGSLLGYLWLIDEPRPLAEAEIAEAQRSAQELGIAVFRARRLEREDREREQELLQRLVGHGPAGESAAAAGELVEEGLLAAAPLYAVVVVRAVHERRIEAPDEVRVRLAAAVQHVRRGVAPRHMLLLDLGAEAVAVLACGDATELERRALALAEEARGGLRDCHGWSALAAIGEAQADVHELPLAQEQARCALRVAGRVGGFDPLARFSELGAYRTLARLVGEQDRLLPLPACVQRLLACEEARVLVPTLECFLDRAGDARAAAEQLHVHRSSLYSRLHRIEEAAGVDLRRGEDRLELHLGLRLWRLRGSLPAL